MGGSHHRQHHHKFWQLSFFFRVEAFACEDLAWGMIWHAFAHIKVDRAGGAASVRTCELRGVFFIL